MTTRPCHLLACLVATGLVACTTTPVAPVIDLAQTERRAVDVAARGDLVQAARLYRDLADATAGATQAGYLIESAQLEMMLRNNAQAGQLLTLAERQATASQRITIEIMRARVELAQGMAAQALARVDALPPQSGAALGDVLEIRGRALFALGRPTDAIRALTEREVWLDDVDAIRANQRLIWDAMRAAPLTNAPPPTGDPTIDGWLELGRIAGVFLEDDRRRELIQWRTRNNRHPAARILLSELLLDTLGAFPNQIALLLPLGSAVRDNAIAIRDGFLAAHLAAQHGGTSIRVYDTAQEGVAAAYQRAELDGATFIVGPLLRNDVEIVMRQAGLVPTLALNYSLSDSPRPINTYEFGFAPEDEARASAQYALAQGLHRAVALIQSSDRGYRIYNSFREEFERGGGQVVSIMGYDTDVRNYSARITALLNIDRSNQRHRRLAANLRSPLSFEPRRRQDIDVIFLAANANDGRLLAPQLEYYYAGDVPTVAISEIYDPLVTRDTRDLDRIIYPDVPWLITPSAEDAALRRTIANRWPLRDATVPRFYGLGFDAYKIVEAIYGEPFFTSIRGASGLLTMDVEGRIHRSLPFAQIRNGVPEPILALPQPETPGTGAPAGSDAIGLLSAPRTDDARVQTSR